MRACTLFAAGAGCCRVAPIILAAETRGSGVLSTQQVIGSSYAVLDRSGGVFTATRPQDCLNRAVACNWAFTMLFDRRLMEAVDDSG